MDLRKHKGLVVMEPMFEQIDIQQPTRRLSIVNADPAKQMVAAGSCNSTDSATTTDSMRSRVRLRAQDGSPAKPSEGRAEELLRMLNKTSMSLDAKRSQLKKMQQLSKLKFISRLISHDYLNELSDDIAWYEAVVAKTANNLNELDIAPKASLEVVLPPASLHTTG